MSNRLLIELLPSEIRVAMARGGSRVWEIVDSFSVEVAPDWNAKAGVDALKSALATRSIPARGDVDVIVGRRDVEIREIGLPPAPDNELPEMVRFTARNEFTQVTDSTQLDFAPVRGGAETPRTVIAATLHGDSAALATGLASGLGLRLRRILIRPWCVAHSVIHQLKPESSCLLVEDVGDSVEMALWHEGHLLLTRSFRTGDSGNETAVAEEIQRTLMVSQRALSGRPVNELVIIGEEGRLGLEKRESFPHIVHVTPSSTRHPSGKKAGRDSVFSAHRGALNFLERSTGDMLDFQNPRRVVRKTIDKKQITVWASIAALVLISIFVGVWFALSSQGKTIARMNAELAELQKSNAPEGNRPGVEQIQGEVGLLDTWMAARVNWLEELQEISDRMLTPDDAMVDVMRMTSSEKAAVIGMEGHVLNMQTGTDVKTNLDGRPFAVVPGATRNDSKSPDYPITFDYALSRELDSGDTIRKLSDRARESLLKSKPSTPEPVGEAGESTTGKTSQESGPDGSTGDGKP